MRVQVSAVSLILLASMSLLGCAHSGRNDHREFWDFKIEETPAEMVAFVNSTAALGSPGVTVDGSGDSLAVVANLQAGVQERVIRTASYNGQIWVTDDNGSPKIKRCSFVEKGNERNPQVPLAIHEQADPGEVVRTLSYTDYPVSVEWAIIPAGSTAAEVTDSWVAENVKRFAAPSAGGGGRPMRGFATPIFGRGGSGPGAVATHQIRLGGEDLAFIRNQVVLEGARFMLVVKASSDRPASDGIKASSWYELRPPLSEVVVGGK